MPSWKPFEFETDRSWADEPMVADSAVGRALVVGDMHRSMSALGHAASQAKRHEVDVIVQVGDFWLGDRHWSGHDSTEAAIMRYAHELPVPIVVVDGNHEAWPALGRYALTPAARAAMQERRPLHLGGSIWWAWRGSVWQWSGVRCGALGGAVSPDRENMAVHQWRWHDEATTEDDLSRLTENAISEFDGSLDVLFTHEAPLQVKGLKSQMSDIPPHVQIEMDRNRRLLADAVDRTAPQYLFHGHWHQANRETINKRTQVVGLSYEDMISSSAIMALSSAAGDASIDVRYTPY